MSYDLPASIDPKGPVGDAPYVVQEGDCIDSIAFAAGHLWQTIWNHPNNAALKALRVSRNILFPGDQVFIPPITESSFDRPTDQMHKFALLGAACKLRVCLLVAGQPRAHEDYTLVVDDHLVLRGTSDGEGWIEVRIPPNAAQGKLTIGGDPLQPAYTLDLGGMDPITEPKGLQKRLRNLGFHCDVTGQMDDATCGALAMFQKAEDLDATGKADRDTLVKLKKRCGC
jgi:Putative peptidoglycan binding domain